MIAQINLSPSSRKNQSIHTYNSQRRTYTFAAANPPFSASSVYHISRVIFESGKIQKLHFNEIQLRALTYT